MNMKRRLLAVGMIAMFSLAAAGCGSTEIGYMDSLRVQNESPQLKTIIEDAQQKMIDAQMAAEADLKAKQDAGMSEEELQQEMQKAAAKLQGQQQQVSLQIEQKVQAVIGEIAREKKLDAVVRQDAQHNAKVVVQGGTDITDEVIAKLQ
ncbi:hypothetical protein TAMA11512_06820 [Selenomonas sp. TAMA-11512]|uniref:OmpH family outer membrane protein n=1 Tax=Selenomonas sp. TAMA-11512 TaxID=3095337 RepID=UPI0030923C40|nr:hypothetical protein TAMA11512_06820 [Selenomonas sp. TAMA-11512]